MRKQGHNISNRLDPFEQKQVCVESQRAGCVGCPCWLLVRLIGCVFLSTYFFSAATSRVDPASWLFVTASSLIGSVMFRDYSISATILFRTLVAVHSKAAIVIVLDVDDNYCAQRDPPPRVYPTLDIPVLFLLSIYRFRECSDWYPLHQDQHRVDGCPV